MAMEYRIDSFHIKSVAFVEVLKSSTLSLADRKHAMHWIALQVRDNKCMHSS